MKRLLANTLMLVGGLTASTQLLALGLGELKLKSALNQPLQAEIELVDTQGLSQWEIKPTLASAADFERAGVDRLYFLTKISFKVEGDRVVLTSREPVNEPFLNFLIELNWPAGRVLREYTVLLDPPTFKEETIQPLVAAPYTAAPAGQQVVTRTEQPSETALSRWESEPAAEGTYKVQQDDTLWAIALATRPDRSVTPQQMMVAIQEANPHAFIGGNINRLKTHQVLNIPDAAQVRAVSFRNAVAEVDRQNREATGAAQIDATGRAGKMAEASEARDGGEVRLLTARSNEADSAGVSGDVAATMGSERQQALENDLAIALENVDKSRLENQELRQRLESLEEQINTLQRLISLKDDQLATMQVGAAEQQKAEEAKPAEAVAPAAETAAAETTAAEQPAAETPAAEGQVDFNYNAGGEQPAEAAVAADDEAAKAAAAKKEAEEAAARRARIAAMMAEQEKANRPQPGLVDEMMENPQIPLAGLGVLALIGVLLARMLKKRKEAKAAEQEELMEDNLALDEQDVDSSNLDDFDFGDDALDGQDDDRAGADDIALDDEEHPQQFETVAQTEDVISESDIYIAYGKFEQAVDLLKDAIAKEPSRSDLRLKLLEVYVEMDEAEAFAKEEAALRSLGDRAASGQAEQMRNRLSSPVAPAAMAAGAAAAGLSLDDDIPSLDDNMADEFADGLDFGDALDISEELDEPALLSDADDGLTGQGSGLEEVPTLDLDDGLDFDLSIDEAAAEADDDIKPVVSKSGAQDDGLDFDLSGLDDAEEAAPVKAAAAPSLEDALEFDLSSFEEEASDELVAEEAPVVEDDLSLDFDLAVEEPAGDELGDLLDGKTQASDELPDLSFDMEETTGFAEAGDDDLQSLEDELSALSSAPAADTDVAELDFSEDMSELDAELTALEAESAEAETLDAFELDDETVALAAEPAALTNDMDDIDIPQLTTQDGEIDLDELAAVDDEFDYLAGTDECATKLDLARAYIDMEDFDGAKELLQEVVQEGSDQQKTDARELMNSLS